MLMKKSIPVFLLLFSGIFLSKCTLTDDLNQLQDAIDSLYIVIGTPEFTTAVHIEFIDASSNEYISGQDVEVQISGKNASAIFSNMGTKESTFIAKHGFLDLIVNPAVVDTNAMKTTPIEFDVSVKSNQYRSVTQRVRLFSDGRTDVIIKLINLSNTPEGVTAAINNNFTATLPDGRTLQSAAIAMNGGQQSVTIPAGIVLKDANGNAISGTVKSEIIYFDPTSESAQDAFPGGLNVSARMEDNSTEEIQFVSAGMFTISLTAGNQTVKTLENGGITLKTTVPESLINPNTGLPVKDGDVIELWSLNEGSGEWVFEKMDTIYMVGGQLVLEETVTHLSSWNWDFFYSACSLGPKFIWRGNLTTKSAYAKITAKSPNLYSAKVTYQFVDPASSWFNHVQLYNTPRNVVTDFTFEDAGFDASRRLSFNPSTLRINNLCAGGTYIINVSETIIPSEMVNVNFDLTATSASNSQIVIKPNAYFYYRSPSVNWWYSFYLRNGKTTLELRLGQTYTILGYFGNNYGQGTLLVEKAGANEVKVTLTPSIQFASASSSNAVSFNLSLPANNTIDIKYNAVLPDNIFNQLR